METYILRNVGLADKEKLKEGCYLVSLHATRIPPHIGILADGEYHSLTVKGKDMHVPLEALIKNIHQRKLPSLFIRIAKHPVFSDSYLSEHFLTDLQGFTRVEAGEASCLSPIKLFFEENWSLDLGKVEYLYHLLPVLEERKIMGESTGFFMEEHLVNGNYRLPYYTWMEINRGIEQVRAEFQKR